MSLLETLIPQIGITQDKIVLSGKFELEGNSSHPQGPVRATNSQMPDGTISIGDQVERGSFTHCHEEIYWLPWRNGAITTAKFAEMNESGCKYFLTSTFSGCRFVATESSASHIAFWQDGYGISSVDRDWSEWVNLHGGQAPRLRRKLSINGFDSVDIGRQSNGNFIYGNGQDANGYHQGNAVVMGHKTDQGNWKFKALIYNVGLTYWVNLN